MSTEWALHWMDPEISFPRQDPITGTWQQLRARERLVGISRDHPVLLSPDLKIDYRLSDFFRRSRFATLALGSRQSYVLDYRLFFSFLWSRGLDWDQATEDDVRDWHNWRRLDPDNPRRIGGAKWNRELVALRLLYGWALQKGYLPNHLGALDQLSARDARSTNVKWLTRRAFREWRSVGLRGYLPSGLRDPSFKGRQSDRNAAFADLLFSSGVRLREGGSLLTSELPAPDETRRRYFPIEVAAATAKTRGRFAYVSTEALGTVTAYVDSTRAQSVQKAQSSGLYATLPGLLIVDSIISNGEIRWHDSEGKAGSLFAKNADSELRRRLFVSTAAGLEPLALWLDESGNPMDFQAWKKIFKQASSRCAKHGLSLRCTPHMLRHSFALHMLVSLQYAFDRRLGLSAEDRRYYQEIYGNIWVLVRDLLGHASEETTINIYLEPVRGLQLDTILNESEERDVDELLTRIARETGLVLDIS